LFSHSVFTIGMNLLDLTTNQLKRAASIKEQIDELTNELKNVLGVASNGAAKEKGNRLSAAARSRIAAAQKARWAKARKAKTAKPAVQAVAKKSTMSAAAKAKVSARMKAFWKKKRAGKKTASSAK
jgi:hypothetical protein